MTATTYDHPIDAYDTTDLQAEVLAVNTANGWFEDDRSLDDGVALLHSEVSEALEAYRRWKLEDRTRVTCTHKMFSAGYDQHDGNLARGGHVCKPEGVGSELADVLIRLLDETHRQGLELVRSVMVRVPEDAGFGTIVKLLHRDVARFGDEPTSYNAAIIFGRLVSAADACGIDLAGEYVRKIAYNKTRGHKHGGKHL